MWLRVRFPKSFILFNENSPWTFLEFLVIPGGFLVDFLVNSWYSWCILIELFLRNKPGILLSIFSLARIPPGLESTRNDHFSGIGWKKILVFLQNPPEILLIPSKSTQNLEDSTRNRGGV